MEPDEIDRLLEEESNRDLIDDLLDEVVGAPPDQSISKKPDDLFGEIMQSLAENSDEVVANPMACLGKMISLLKNNFKSKADTVEPPKRKISNPTYIHDIVDAIRYRMVIQTLKRRYSCKEPLFAVKSGLVAVDTPFLLRDLPVEKQPLLAAVSDEISGKATSTGDSAIHLLKVIHPVVNGLSCDGYDLRTITLLGVHLVDKTEPLGIYDLPEYRNPCPLDFYHYPSRKCAGINVNRDAAIIAEAEAVYDHFLNEIQVFVDNPKMNTVLKFVSRNTDVTTIVLEYQHYMSLKPLSEILESKYTTPEQLKNYGTRREVLRFHHTLNRLEGCVSFPEVFPLQMIYDGTKIFITEEAALSIKTGIIPVDISSIDHNWIDKIRGCLMHPNFNLMFVGLDNAKARSHFCEPENRGQLFRIGELNMMYNLDASKSESEKHDFLEIIVTGRFKVLVEDFKSLVFNNRYRLNNGSETVGTNNLKAFREGRYYNVDVEEMIIDKKSFTDSDTDDVANETIRDRDIEIKKAMDDAIETLGTRPLFRIVDARKAIVNKIDPRTFYPPGLWNGCDLTLAWDLKRIIALARYKPQDSDCYLSRLPLDIINLIFKELDMLIIRDIEVEYDDFILAVNTRENNKIHKRVSAMEDFVGSFMKGPLLKRK